MVYLEDNALCKKIKFHTPGFECKLLAHLYYQVGHSIFTPFLINSSFGSCWVLSLSNYQYLPLQLSDNEQRIIAINNCGRHDHKFCQICSCRFHTKKGLQKNLVASFCPILTNFLPKCRAQNHENVISEKGHGTGKKGMALEKRGMARRHSKSG